MKGLAQANIGKGAGHVGRDGGILFAALGDVARGVCGLHVAPALKGAAWDGFCQDHLAIKVDGAAKDAVFTAGLLQPKDALAAQDQALDDPVKAASLHVGLTLWPHAGDVNGGAGGPTVALAVLPIGQVFDAIGADAEFLKMQHMAPDSPGKG